MPSPLTIDFTRVSEIRQHRSGKLMDQLPSNQRPLSSDGKVLTKKQIRARARRKMKRSEVMSREEADVYYGKPIEEWDLEELARGRPRNAKGTFSGLAPKWMKAEVHERAMEQFTAVVKEEMNVTTIDALKMLTTLMNDNEVDDKGKPIVPASTKLDAAKFLIEHIIGKPKQRIETDISVKLQGILGQVMVNPADALGTREIGGGGYTIGHLPGVTIPMDDPTDETIYDAEVEIDGYLR